MRILRIADIQIVPTGGMGRVLLETSHRLREYGHEVDLLGSDQICAKKDVGGFFRSYIVPFITRQKVKRLLDENQDVDLIEIHEPLGFGMILPRRLRDKRNRIIPVVVMSHGVEERGRWVIPGDQTKGILKRFHRKIRDFLVWWGLKNADAVMCLNQTDLGYLNKSGVKRAYVVSNGVEMVSCNNPNIGKNFEKNICFLGTWIERKGNRVLVEAFSAIREQFPESRLLIVGTGVSEGDVKKDFLLKDKDSVDVLPFFDGRLGQILDGYDFFILPSYFEGFPLSMLEAAALSKVLITSDNSGMKDFIQDGHNGFLFKTGDVSDLVSKIKFCFNNISCMRQIGENARISASAFTWEKSASSIEKVYQMVLQ